MRKTLKRTLATLMVVAIILCAAPLNGFVGLELPDWLNFDWLNFSTKASALDVTGKCGENLTYTFNSSTGLLTISGTGSMSNYNYLRHIYSPFRRNSSIKAVVIENGVTTIGSEAFYECSGLTSVTIPDSVTVINNAAFFDCSNLTSVIIPDSVTYIGDSAFHLCSRLTNITIPDSVTKIGYGTFYDCKSLTSVTIGNSVTTIYGKVFFRCTSLTNITIGNGVTHIQDDAFGKCTGLTSVTIPDNVTYVGGNAFSFCTGLASVSIGNGVMGIGDFPFGNCIGLTSITVAPNNKNYSSDKNGVLYNKDKTKLIKYPVGNVRTSFTIPDSVTSIYKNAFCNCSSLTNITIPKSVTSIGDYAFRDCTRLTSVTIPDCVTSIGYSTFEGCTALTCVTIGNRVKIIYQGAFSGCASLKDIYYAGSRDEWEKITIQSLNLTNSSLKNATIHFNSNYQDEPDDPETPEEKHNQLVCSSTYDQDYYWTGDGFYGEKAQVTDSIELYLELENFAPIYDHPDPDRTPKTLNNVKMTATVNTNKLSFAMDSYQSSYSYTFAELEEYKTYDDLILLYPQAGFQGNDQTYTVTLTFESDDIETVTEQYSITVHTIAVDTFSQHLKFEKENLVYRSSKRNYYGHNIQNLRNDAEYKWSRFTSLDFKNYYKVVVADLFSEMLSVEKMQLNPVPEYIRTWKKNADEIRSGLNTLIYDGYGDLYDISETKIDKLFKASKYTENGIHTEDVLYQATIKMFGNTQNVNKLTKVFAAADKTGQVIGLLKFGKDVINDTLDGVHKLALLEAFSEADESFKSVIREVYNNIPASESKMREALQDYLIYDFNSSGAALETYRSICDMSWNITMTTFKSIFGKKLLDYFGAQLVTWVGNIPLASGALLSSTAAFSTVTSAASGFFTGVSLGFLVSDILCDSSDKAKEMAKAVSMAEYSPYIIIALSNVFADMCSHQEDDYYTERYEYAVALHKAAQVYIVDHTCKAMEHKRNSLMYLFADKKSMDDVISSCLYDKSTFSELKCHSDDPIHVDGNQTTKRKVIKVKCPVNVYVYDSKGTEVVRIINDVAEYTSEEIDYSICGSEKYILVPYGEDYDIKIVATDSGTMSYSVVEMTPDGKQAEYGKSNIVLTKGQIFTGDITEDDAKKANEYDLRTNNITISVEEIKEGVAGRVNSVAIDDVSLNYKKSTTLKPVITADEGITYTVKYESSNPKVATVDKDGNVYGASAGTVRITCTVTDQYGNTVSDTCSVSVIDTSIPEVVFSFVVESETEDKLTVLLKLEEGAFEGLDLEIITTGLKCTGIKKSQELNDFISEYEHGIIACNPSKGLVSFSSSFKAYGTQSVFLLMYFDKTDSEYSLKGKTHNCAKHNTLGDIVPIRASFLNEIDSSKKCVKNVKIDNSLIVYKETITIKPQITADDGVKYTVKYESSNPKVATVDKDGNVYGAKKGTAQIKVTVTDENNNTVTDTCKVTVKYSGLQWFIIIVLFGWIWYLK